MVENRWNIPNAIALFRLVGSFALVGIALMGARTLFAWLLLVLLASDWIDGKLAIWLRQCTIFGARLDSTADAAMYGALLFGLMWLESAFVWQERLWIAGALATYALTTAAGLVRYRRIPSYHTRAAKTTWLLVAVAAVTIFADGPAWPLRLAMAAAIWTNLEATAMTMMLPDWQADVPSIWHAWRLRQGPRQAPQEAVDGERE